MPQFARLSSVFCNAALNAEIDQHQGLPLQYMSTYIANASTASQYAIAMDWLDLFHMPDEYFRDARTDDEKILTLWFLYHMTLERGL